MKIIIMGPHGERELDVSSLSKKDIVDKIRQEIKIDNENEKKNDASSIE